MSSVDTLTPPPPDNRLINTMMGISLLAHVVVIGLVRFGPVDPSKLFNRAPLDIVLVNSHSPHAPTKAEQLAQANLNGGGNTDTANRHIKTPLPAQDVDATSAELTLASQQVKDQEERQRRLLSELQNANKLLADAHAAPNPTDDKLKTDAQQRQASEIARQQGEISREIDAYQSRPHKAFVGARTKGVAEAQYVDKWRGKIERIGTLNYPADGHGQRLSGMLIVTVEIRADGTLGAVEVNRSSGNRALDEAALRIVRQAAPFPPLPPAIFDASGKPADILSITRAWTFSRGDIQMTNPPLNP